MLKFPKQRLSYSDKIKDDFKWAKDTMKYLCTYSYQNSEYYNDYNDLSKEFNRKLSNYQLYNNIINQADFEKECNPLGLTIKPEDDIKPYNKTYNKIQVLLGEELKRPFSYRCIISNTEGIKQKELIKTHKLKH
jgi:hypothetical protein